MEEQSFNQCDSSQIYFSDGHDSKDVHVDLDVPKIII